MEEFDKFAEKLEEFGELEVRERLAHGVWSDERKLSYIAEWLRRLEEERSNSRAAIRDARELETLSIAKEANRIASEARIAAFEQARWAKWAAIIATTAAIIAAVAAMAGK